MGRQVAGLSVHGYNSAVPEGRQRARRRLSGRLRCRTVEPWQEPQGVLQVLFDKERQEVAYFMRRLYRQGLTTTSGGNVSRRAGGDHIVLTASASDKGELQAADVGVLALAGDNVTPALRPSIEAAMHLAIYRRHAGVGAIVHAHPTVAGLFCASDTLIDTHLTAEAYAVLGDPVVAPYACMGSAALADTVAAAVAGGVCVLMRNHGVLTVGSTLLQAFDRLEVLEVAARQTYMALGRLEVECLAPARLRELDRMLGR
ncbi:MAG: class II aldolase/adducin family protein [Lentisphaeria bacterium]|nr:class II aldolase/adducin family protein [Lentisphaeria bacterium]